MKVGLQI